jgi:hypothetical protein
MINILIEGADGVGKSTLVDNLRRHINAHHPSYHAISIREPGDSIPGLRDMFLNPGSKLCRKAVALLATASAAQTEVILEGVENVVRADDRQLVVVRDRSVVSTMVYQGLDNDEVDYFEIMSMYADMLPIKFDATFILSGLETDDQSDDVFTKFGHSKLAHEGYRYVLRLLTYVYDKAPNWLDDAPKWVRNDVASKFPDPIIRAQTRRMFPKVNYTDTYNHNEDETLEYAYQNILPLISLHSDKATV